MKKVKNLINRLKEKKGSFSLEAVWAMSGVLMITFLGISYFTYLVPRQMLTQEVHSLAQTAKIQGGLTDETSEPGSSDVERFKESLSEKGFDADHVTVTAEASKMVNDQKVVRNVMGAEPLSDGYVANSIYSHRDSKEVITVHVTIPAKMSFINAMTKYWTGHNSDLGDYEFSETIMSERW